jgi:hypothetical protein
VEIQWLTIGYIPKNCSEDRIICGDSDMSGTEEISLSICGDKISAIESSAEVEVNPAGFFDEKLKLWDLISQTFFTGVFTKTPNLSKLFSCYQIFIDEIERADGVYLLAEEDEIGEFINEKGCYNDTFYVRYQLEENDNFFCEKILGFKN